MLDYVHNVGFFKFLFILILAWLKNNTMIVYESYATSQKFVKCFGSTKLQDCPAIIACIDSRLWK